MLIKEKTKTPEIQALESIYLLALDNEPFRVVYGQDQLTMALAVIAQLKRQLGTIADIAQAGLGN
jgi:hypothetical protein